MEPDDSLNPNTNRAIRRAVGRKENAPAAKDRRRKRTRKDMSYLTRGGSRCNILPTSDCFDAAIGAGSILTAIPVGRKWCIKAIAKDGEITLLGYFEGRLATLGAAVLLSLQCCGRVVP